MGAVGRNANANSQQSLGALVTEIGERSQEHYTILLESGFRTASFQKIPIVSGDLIGSLRLMHPYTLWLTDTLFCNAQWRAGMQILYKCDGNTRVEKPLEFSSPVARASNECRTKAA